MPIPRARLTTILILLSLVASVVFFLAFRRFPRPAVAGAGVEALLKLAEGGDERAARQLLEQLQRGPSSRDEALLARMFKSEQALVRAAACTTIGREHQVQFAGAIWPRLSDDDWRVRAAGFEALHDLAGDRVRFNAPLRDTPVEQRERIILDAMSQWRKHDVLTPLPRLCELYPTLDHWLTGPALTESCLTCHAPSKETYSASQQCMSCHMAIHSSWFASAHSRSVSHLPLARVDPVTKKVVLWNHGQREGLDCLVCHREANANSVAANITPVRPPLAGTRHRFDRAISPSASCASCHSDVQQQWETWQSNPRPRMATWPPGAVERSSQTLAQSCVDCHMRSLATPIDKALPHSFNTRRNPQFLSEGLIVRIEPATSDQPLRAILTNLAGHSYPTGTHRRSLRIEIQYDDDPSTRTLIARLKQRDPAPTTQPATDVLAPGEERTFEIPLRPSATSVTCDVTYERNGYVDTGYEVTLAHVTEPLRR